MTTMYVQYSEIWIEAPNGIRLAQWKDEQSDDGLIDLEMPMTAEPILGEWKIVALQNFKKTETTFKVDEYGKMISVLDNTDSVVGG